MKMLRADDPPDRWRIVAALLFLGAMPSFLFCTTHICMAGHMRHPPHPFWQMMSDALWCSLYLGAAVAALGSNISFRRFFVLIPGLLCISRLVLGSLGGMNLLLEVPMCLFLSVVAVRALRRAGVDWSKATDAERCAHRRTVVRRWKDCGVSLLVGAVVLLIGWQVYRWVRVSRVPKVVVTEDAMPYVQRLTMKPDEAIWILLPNGKRIALWNDEFSPFPSWGERPYDEPDRVWIKTEHGRSSDRVRSGIQTGQDMCRSTETNKEYSLFVDDFCVAPEIHEQTSGVYELTVTVRRPEESELVYLRQRYGEWPVK